MTTPRFLFTTGCLSARALALIGCTGAELRPESRVNPARATIAETEPSGARQAAPVLLNQVRDKVEHVRQQSLDWPGLLHTAPQPEVDDPGGEPVRAPMPHGIEEDAPCSSPSCKRSTGNWIRRSNSSSTMRMWWPSTR